MDGRSDENLSMDVLVDDLVALVQTIFKDTETAPVLMVIRFRLHHSFFRHVHANPFSAARGT